MCAVYSWTVVGGILCLMDNIPTVLKGTDTVLFVSPFGDVA